MDKGITKLSVAGFKSISKETTLDIKPLTLLAGANSSGKSSFMQPLLLLKQTLEAPYDPGPLLLDGANVKFTSFDQMLTSPVDKSTKQEFSVSLVSGSIEETMIFSKKSGEITVSFLDIFRSGLRVDSNMNTTGLLEVMDSLNRNSPFFGHLPTQQFIDWEIVRKYCFLSIAGNNRTFKLTLGYPEIFSRIIEEVIHIAGLRGNPERIYQTTGTRISPTFPGTFEKYTANVISHWEEKKSDKLEQLCLNLFHLGLTSRISAKRLNDTQIEVKVGRLPKNGRNKADMVNIADVGFGVSQTLPILVALLVAEPGQLVYLEQPEIHLHPLAQKKLGEILVDTANRGVKVVVETHSSLLLLAVQTLVAKQKIDQNKVALHWFQRNKAGMTDVTTADLDEAGRFGDWPVDFGEVELDAEGDYIDAVSQQAFRQLDNTKA